MNMDARALPLCSVTKMRIVSVSPSSAFASEAVFGEIGSEGL